MPRLTPNEISYHRERLNNWHEPSALSAYVEDVMNHLGSATLFSQGGLGFIRDAWGAARFGAARKAKAVRLIADEWSDFELSVGGAVERFEFTEADLEGRRRGDEFREAEVMKQRGESTVEDDPVEDWIARAEKVPAILGRAVARKIERNYGAKVNLLVYLNIHEFGIRKREIEASFASSTIAAKGRFTSVWVLWNARAYE